MDFLDRKDELGRLSGLLREGGLAVVTGRRRVGKTRLLVEWVERNNGAYFVGDQSTAEVQRQYLTNALATRLPGLEGVRFSDWRSLLTSLAERAISTHWRGPLVLDELPYLVQQSPELPSALQHFVDHDLKRAKISLAIAGSSQRMMQGLALDASAPLYGRANELFALAPLPVGCMKGIFPETDRLNAWTAWGGIPRYWELAGQARGRTAARIDALVLDPLGPLHREPDHILLEELPTALEVRPLLDAIGAGAHRVSEIAGRIGRPATSLARPLGRLIEMGLIRREIPFGEHASKRALYKIADPFFRLWFRIVAPNRGALAVMSPAARKALLQKHWPALASATWEDLARATVPRIPAWGPASRWWEGNEREWDVVADSVHGKKLLLGEVKLHASTHDVERLAAREAPPFAATRSVFRVLFAASGTARSTRDVRVLGPKDVFSSY